VAFVHALKLALASHSSLTIFHFARAAEASHVHEFPQVRETLAQWEAIPPESPRDAVGALGLRVHTVEVEGDDPTGAIVDYLGDHPADLMVLATHQRSGVARWLYQEIASPIVRQSALITLFVPPGVDGFVDSDTGRVRLQRVLAGRPAPSGRSRCCQRSAPSTLAVTAEARGTAATMPRVHLPRADGWVWTTRLEQVTRRRIRARGERGPQR
jgi:nucleotide-binding universal stress UspA family protein